MNIRLAMALSIMTLCVTGWPSFAAEQQGNLSVTTGFGENFEVRHGLFGTKEMGAQDRLGDRYVKKKGILGHHETDINFLGNTYVKKKSWVGGTATGASDILGDTYTSQKTWFGLGRRQTNVNLSGTAGLVQQFVGSRFGLRPDAPPPGGPGISAQPGLLAGAGAGPGAAGGFSAGLPQDSSQSLDNSAGLTP